MDKDLAQHRRGWLYLMQVSRPIVWPVLPLVYLLGMTSARAEMTAAAIIQLLLLTFPMNLLGCGLNDLYDIDSDRRSGRRRAIWGAEVGAADRSLVWWACVAMVPLVVAGAVATGNVYNIAVTLAHIAVAWAYSVPPLRLKERPPLDSLANGAGYFLLPFAMGYSLGAELTTMAAKYYLLALVVCGIHALAAAADYQADRAAGHRTVAVVYGRRAAALVACATFFVAWWWGDYQSAAARGFLTVGLLATLVTAIVPRHRLIVVACVTIFVGFLVATVCHVWLS